MEIGRVGVTLQETEETTTTLTEVAEIIGIIEIGETQIEEEMEEGMGTTEIA